MAMQRSHDGGNGLTCATCGKNGHDESGCWQNHPEKCHLPFLRKRLMAKAAGKEKVLILSPCIPLAELALIARTSGAGYVVDSGCGVTTLTGTAGCSNVRTVQSHWVEDAGLRRHKVTHKADLLIKATDEHGNDYDMHIPDSLIVPSLGINLISTDHLNELQYWVVLGPTMQ